MAKKPAPQIAAFRPLPLLLSVILMTLSSFMGCGRGVGDPGKNIGLGYVLETPTPPVTPVTPPVTTIPLAPTNFTGEPISASQITLTWVDASDNETGFEIERKPESAVAWGALLPLAANSNTFGDGGLAAAAKYFYRIRAVNGLLASVWVESAGIQTMAAPVSAPPTPVLTLQVNGSSSIIVNWTISSDSTNKQQKFYLEAWKTDAPGTLLLAAQEFLADATTFFHPGLLASASYTYRLKAWNQTGYSSDVTAIATTGATPPASPAAPQLTGSRSLSTTEIELTWQITATPVAESFVISRSPAGANTFVEMAPLSRTASGVIVATLVSGDLQYTWIDSTGLNAGHSYDYKIIARNAVGPSGASNVLRASTLNSDPLPTAPMSPNLTNTHYRSLYDCGFCTFDLNWGWPANYPGGDGVTFDVAGGFRTQASSIILTNLNVLTTHLQISDCDADYYPVTNYMWDFSITPKRNGVAGTIAVFAVNPIKCAIIP